MVAVDKRRVGRKRPRFRFLKDCRGQAMTEYVVLAGVMVAVSAYLYYDQNEVFKGMRRTYDKTTLLLRLPGP